MEKICGIYKITSPSKKVYIGQSVDVLLRFSVYKRMACKAQIYLYRSFLKYGVEKHKFEIIQICERNQLDELEKYYIELYQCFNSEYGLNLAAGGNCGGKRSEKTKEKLRLIARNRPPMSQQTRDKIAEANRSRIISKETIRKYVESRIRNGNYRCTEETKLKISHEHQLRMNGFIKVNIEIECACGCGMKFMKYDKWRNERKYINGHNSKIQPRNERGYLLPKS